MLKWLLSILFVVIWMLVVRAPSLPYDDNVASLLLGVMVSLASIVGLGLLYALRKGIFLDNKFAIIIFVLTTNPVTIYLVFFWIPGTMAN